MKKIFAVVLALVLMISLFAGCTNSSQTAAGTDNLKTLLQNTFKQIELENVAAQKNVYGFTPDKEEAYAQLCVNATNLNYPVENMFVLNSLTANMAASVSKEDNELSFSFDGNINNVPVNVLQLLWDDSFIKVASPSLADKTFAIPTTNLTEKWNNSILGQMQYVEYIPDLSLSTLLNSQDLYENAGSAILKATLDFIVSCEKSSEEVTISLNGSDTTVTKFSLVVTDEDAKQYIRNLANEVVVIMENDAYRQSLSQIMGVSEEEYDSVILYLKNELETELSALQFEDVTFYIYGYDSKIVRVEYYDIVENCELSLCVQFENSDCLSEGMLFTISATEQGIVNQVEFELNNNFVSGGEVLSGDIVCNVIENGAVAGTIDMDAVFDYSQNAYEITASVNDGYSNVNLMMNGECYRGDVFEITLDDVVYGDGYSNVSVKNLLKSYTGGDFDIRVKCSSDAGNINLTPTSQTVDVFSLTQEDLSNLQTEVYSNVFTLLSQLGVSLW